MGRINETISTVNSTIRTFLVLAIAGVVATTGYLIYERVSSTDRQLDDARRIAEESKERLIVAEETITGLRGEVVEKSRQIERLETAMRLLKTDKRLAQLEVLEQTVDPETERPITRVRFTEMSPNGDAIGQPKEFEIQGEVVYLDNWVVKFDDKYVEQSDLARGTSLALFRRIFGELESPAEGQLIDAVGAMPQAYLRGGSPSEFEQEIWDDFWTFANDPQAAQKKGIRAAHGEALSMKVQAGRKYRVVLRASDGLSIIPEPMPPVEPVPEDADQQPTGDEA